MYQIICEICGKQFEARVRHTKICSKECQREKARIKAQQKYQEKSGTENRAVINECQTCGKDISSMDKRRKFCSKRCLKKSEWENKKEIKKECEVCGTSFKTKNKETRLCSASCINKATAHPPIMNTCQNCGEQFKVPYIKRNKKFCSRNCSTTFMMNNMTEEQLQDFKNKISETKKQQYASGERIHPWLGKSHSEETKQKIRQNRLDNIENWIGENNPNWRGGWIKEYQAVRMMPEYSSWMKSVYKRDGKKCKICGITEGLFQVDHIVPFTYIIKNNNITNILEARKCKELWDINNGRVLCVECHRGTDTYAGKATTWKP